METLGRALHSFIYLNQSRERIHDWFYTLTSLNSNTKHKFVASHFERKGMLTDYSCLFFKETKALLEQEENLLDKVDDVDSDLERT